VTERTQKKKKGATEETRRGAKKHHWMLGKKRFRIGASVAIGGEKKKRDMKGGKAGMGAKGKAASRTGKGLTNYGRGAIATGWSGKGA